MWCIPKMNDEFKKRMEDILDLYEKPYDRQEPVLCFDEKSKQLIKDTRPVQPAKEKRLLHRDYEYERNGTRNVFMTVEPKGGHREVAVTPHRKKPDFAREMKRIIQLPRYRTAEKIHIVLDNLNTHFEKSFVATFGKEKSEKIMRRILFHYTPTHASWLNMAEIEIGIFSRQSIKGRIPTQEKLEEHAQIWQRGRNRENAMIHWQFTVKDARVKFKYDKGSKFN